MGPEERRNDVEASPDVAGHAQVNIPPSENVDSEVPRVIHEKDEIHMHEDTGKSRDVTMD